MKSYAFNHRLVTFIQFTILGNKLFFYKKIPHETHEGFKYIQLSTAL